MSKGKTKAKRPYEGRKELAAEIRRLSYRHRTERVFGDFVEMAAISFSNAVDLQHREAREKRYMEIVKGYTHEEVQAFPRMLADLAMAIEDAPDTASHTLLTGPDILGSVFHELELHNVFKAQFFSPWNLAYMVGKMVVGDRRQAEALIRDHGFVTACEPACGSGVMILGLARALQDAGVNYQKHLHVTAVDIDAMCVHMAYLQCALWHIPAVIHRGNALSLEITDAWYTPAHVLGFWSSKLRQRGIDEQNAAWWREHTLGRRAEFLQAHGLDLSLAVQEAPASAVIDAREQKSALPGAAE